MGTREQLPFFLVSYLLCCFFILRSPLLPQVRGSPLPQSWALSWSLTTPTSYMISSCPVVSNMFYMLAIPKGVTPSPDSPLNSGLVHLISPRGGHESLSGIAPKPSFLCPHCQTRPSLSSSSSRTTVLPGAKPRPFFSHPTFCCLQIPWPLPSTSATLVLFTRPSHPDPCCSPSLASLPPFCPHPQSICLRIATGSIDYGF